MRIMSARDAKNSFGRLLDLARAEPVAIQKHGRAVVVVMAIEEYEKLQQTKSQVPMKENTEECRSKLKKRDGIVAN